MKKIFIRVCFGAAPVNLNAIRDIVYLERFGVAFDEHNKIKEHQPHTWEFEHKSLNVMDDCIYLYATSGEIEKLKDAGFPVQGFSMYRWIAL